MAAFCYGANNMSVQSFGTRSKAYAYAKIAPSIERSPKDYAIEFGEYLATAAEDFMAEQNRAAASEETPDADLWRALEGAIYEFRKRAAKCTTQ